MMRKPLLAIALLLGCLAAQAQNSKEAIKEAKAFINGIYASYRTETPDLYGKGGEAFFTPAFLKLLQADHTGAQTLNYDPFCACTEPHKTALSGSSVELQTPTLAIAQVMVLEANGERNKLRLVLVWTADGWRIDDVSTKETPSLRATLAPSPQ